MGKYNVEYSAASNIGQDQYLLGSTVLTVRFTGNNSGQTSNIELEYPEINSITPEQVLIDGVINIMAQKFSVPEEVIGDLYHVLIEYFSMIKSSMISQFGPEGWNIFSATYSINKCIKLQELFKAVSREEYQITVQPGCATSGDETWQIRCSDH